jgi:general secretion pathway protein H
MRADGFSVIELVVGLGVATALVGIAVVGLAVLVDGARLAGGVRVVATTLRVARGRALADGTAIEVRFDRTLRMCETRDAGGRVIATSPLPPGISFAAVPVRARIAFGALGTAENGTITLGAGMRQRSVVVNQRGRVRMS